MSGGDSGGGSTSSTSRPLTAAERTDIFNAAMQNMGGYMPKASDYQGYEIVDPSADRGRGTRRNFSTGYDGYSNIAPRTVSDRGDSFYGAVQSMGRDQQNAMAAYLDDYFKKRDSAAAAATSEYNDSRTPG